MIEGVTRTGGRPGSPVTLDEPAERLHQRIVTGPVAQRTGGAERAHVAIDQARVRSAHRLAVDAKARDEPWPQVLDDDVGSRDQVSEAVELRGVLEVDRDRDLVAVQALERGRGAVPERRTPRPRIVAGARLLDLDHACAKIGQNLSRERGRDAVPDLDRDQAVESGAPLRDGRSWSPHRSARLPRFAAERAAAIEVDALKEILAQGPAQADSARGRRHESRAARGHRAAGRGRR